MANKFGIEDVYININNLNETHDYLLKTNESDIILQKSFDRSKWEEYAKKGG